MAASNKAIGYQIALAILSVLTLVGWVMWYVTFRDMADNQGKVQQATTEKAADRKAIGDQDDQIQALKQIAGYSAPEVGEAGQPNSVMGMMTADLTKATQEHGLPTQTLAAAVQFLSQKVKDSSAELVTVKQELTTKNTDYAALESRYKTMADQHDQARQKAEDDTRQIAKSKDEESRAKQQQIDDLRRANNDLQTEFDAAKAAWETEEKKYESELRDLVAQVEIIREKLKQATRSSFEVPDGLVRWVDNNAKLVWINIGSDDGLKVRTTFSVYRKAHHGVARRAEDIKGQIEVTRIIDGRTAEAKIVDNDIFDPIAKSDPIYTPLWSRGRAEKFAVVGVVDLDSDTIPDRDQFHELIADAGASLTHEVLDDARRVRYIRYPDEWVDWNEGDAMIDSDTKYLIIADIPDPSLAAEDNEKERRTNIARNLEGMRNEARRLGVEEIRLTDFLAYMGYKPQRRLYIPGVGDRPFNLRSGAASVTTNEAIIDRSAAGAVSGVYSRSKRLKPGASAGSVSDLYRGGSK